MTTDIETGKPVVVGQPVSGAAPSAPTGFLPRGTADKTVLSIFLKLVPGAIAYSLISMLKQAGFSKPTFVTFVVFASTLLTLPYFWCVVRPRSMAEGKKNKYDVRAFVWVALPALLDFTSFAMIAFAMQHVPASLAMLTKGSRIVYTALLSMIVLRRQQWLFQWTAVLLSTGGIALNGWVNAQAKKSEENKVVFGLCLALLGEAIRALRSVAEERFMKNYELHPVFVHCIEGIYCTTLGIVFLLIADAIPGKDHGVMENLGHSFEVIGKSATVDVLLAALFFFACFGTLGGVMVNFHLSAVHNAILSESRALLVWGIDLVVFYASVQNKFGTKLSEYFYLELIGFLLVMVSGFVYHGMLRIPGLPYPPPPPRQS